MSGDKTQVRTEVSANTAEQELLGRLSTKTHLLSLQYTAMPGKQPAGQDWCNHHRKYHGGSSNCSERATK